MSLLLPRTSRSPAAMGCRAAHVALFVAMVSVAPGAARAGDAPRPQRDLHFKMPVRFYDLIRGQYFRISFVVSLHGPEVPDGSVLLMGRGQGVDASGAPVVREANIVLEVTPDPQAQAVQVADGEYIVPVTHGEGMAGALVHVSGNDQDGYSVFAAVRPKQAAVTFYVPGGVAQAMSREWVVQFAAGLLNHFGSEPDGRGLECTPSFAEGVSTAQFTCGSRGVCELTYSCTSTGVTCSFKCCD